MPSNLKQIKFHLPDEQAATLARKAKEQGLSVSELIRQALVAQNIIKEPNIQHGGNRY